MFLDGGSWRVLRIPSKVLKNFICKTLNYVTKFYKKFVWLNFLNVSVWFSSADSKNAISFFLSSIVFKIWLFSFFCDFPLTVCVWCSHDCCDLSLSALSCCKSAFYLIERVNGYMRVRNLTVKSIFITCQFSVFVLSLPVKFRIVDEKVMFTLFSVCRENYRVVAKT